MRFLMIHYPLEDQAPPSPEFRAEMGKFVEAETRAGRLLMTGGMLPPSQGGARVRCVRGKFTVLDGPYTEAKELVGGFAVIEVKSREEALEASRRFYQVAGDGEGEIRQLM